VDLTKVNLCSVIVTFQPNTNVLDLLICALSDQVACIVVVDNGSHADMDAWRASLEVTNVELLKLGENKGIATAHNVGIDWARKQGAQFVLLMDQDSLPAPNMVELLHAAISANPLAAAAGPRYFDERQNNPPPFVRFHGLRMERCACDTENTVVPVDYVISSGCLIPMAVLDKVGGMRDDLFIDYVDVEWGLRARHFGFQSYGVCAAHMQHSLGDAPMKFFGRQIPLHSPLRHYYHFRNAVLIYKEGWAPLNWKLVDGWRLFLKYGFYSLFAKPRIKHWWMMTLGVWHGLIGKAGKLGN